MKKALKKHKKNIALAMLGMVFLVAPFVMQAGAWAPQEINFDPNQNILRNSGLGNKDPIVLTAGIINWVLGLLGLIALCLIIYGGFIWMFSRGNEEEIGRAKEIIIGAVIGMVIILASYGIAAYVFNNLANITTG